MRHAIYAPPFATFGDIRLLVDFAIEAEAAGWDGFFLWDHIHYAEPVPFADAWISVAAIAQATERIRIGPLITPLPRRRPWKVAREAVAVDHLSAGRLVFGAGLGIDFWREFAAFDEPATDDRERAELLDDGLEIISRLWTGEPVTYKGTRLSVDNAQFLPRPMQEPRIPIWTAALWPLRPGPTRRAARWDGVMPFGVAGPMSPDDVHVLVAEIGRRRTIDAPFDVCILPRDRIDPSEYEAAGATWLVMSFGPDEPVDEVRRVIAEGPPR